MFVGVSTGFLPHPDIWKKIETALKTFVLPLDGEAPVVDGDEFSTLTKVSGICTILTKYHLQTTTSGSSYIFMVAGRVFTWQIPDNQDPEEAAMGFCERHIDTTIVHGAGSNFASVFCRATPPLSRKKIHELVATGTTLCSRAYDEVSLESTQEAYNVLLRAKPRRPRKRNDSLLDGRVQKKRKPVVSRARGHAVG